MNLQGRGLKGKFWGYLGATVFLLAIWHYAAWSLNNPLLPNPKAAILATIRLFDADLGRHFWVSTYRVVLSTLTALLVGLPLGLIMGYERSIDRFLAPLVYITYPIPKIVFLPLILLFLGLGDSSKIFLITFIVFFQILVTTRDAVRKVQSETISSLRSLGGNRLQVYRYVLWPTLSISNRLRSNALSHDPSVVNTYQVDSLVHKKISISLFTAIDQAGGWAMENAVQFNLPLLLMHGGGDRITSPEASKEFAGSVTKECSLKTWPGLFHELHNEFEKDVIFDYIINWLNQVPYPDY